MPFAIAVLTHSISGYCLLVAAIAALVYAAYVPGAFVAAFAGVGATLLAILAFMAAPPPPAGLVAIALGVVLFNVEFRLPTYGCAGAAGLGAATLGSWWLLTPIAPAFRFSLAVGGTLLLLAAVGRALRRHTLPP